MTTQGKLFKLTEKEAYKRLRKIYKDVDTTWKFKEWLHGFRQNSREENIHKTYSGALRFYIKRQKMRCPKCLSYQTVIIEDNIFCQDCQHERKAPNKFENEE